MSEHRMSEDRREHFAPTPEATALSGGERVTLWWCERCARGYDCARYGEDVPQECPLCSEVTEKRTLYTAPSVPKGDEDRAAELERTFRHYHRQAEDMDDSACLECGMDLRDPIHNVNSAPTTEESDG